MLSSKNKEAILNFFKKNQKIDDEKFHSFVEGLGLDPHEAEEYVYSQLKLKLQKSHEGKTVSEEISHLVKDKGYLQKRAVAAALSMEKEGEIKKDKKKKKKTVEKSFEFLIGNKGNFLLKSSNQIESIRQSIFNLETLRDEFDKLYPDYKQRRISLAVAAPDDPKYDENCENKKRFLFEYKYRIMTKIYNELDKDLNNMEIIKLLWQFTEKIEKITDFYSE